MQKRDKKGKFAGKKKWFVVLPIFGAFAIQPFLPHGVEEFTAPEVIHPVLAEVKGKTYEEKIAQAKKNVVDELAKCETGTVENPDGAIVFDSNNEASVGAWQFQRATVKLYIKKFYNKIISNSEAIALSIDHEKAGELTERILFTEKEGWRNWTNCSKQLGLAQKIEIIKEIEAI